MGATVAPSMTTASRPSVERLPSWKRSAPLLPRHFSDPAVLTSSTTTTPTSTTRKPALRLSPLDMSNNREPGSHWSPDTDSTYSSSSANLFEASFIARPEEVPKVTGANYTAWQNSVTPRSSLRQDTTHVDEEFESGRAEICHARMVSSDLTRRKDTIINKPL